MRMRIRTALLLLIDLAMVALEWRALSGAWRDSGVRMLRYYTQDSNLLAMAVCGVCLAGEVGCLIRNRPLQEWMRIARYISACCLMVTFLVAALVLAPMEPGETLRSIMLKGNLLYLHTVCPLMMLLSAMLHRGKRLTAKHALCALAPTVIYGAVSIAMNVRGAYSGPYPFLRVTRQPVYTSALWCVVIFGGNYAVARLIGRLSGGEIKR